MKTKPEYDAVIVGAGAGGGSCAWSLAQQGLQVLVLEAGPGFSADPDYPQTGSDWELTRFPEKPRSQGRYSFASEQPIPEKFNHLLSWNRANGSYNTTGVRQYGKYYHVRGVGGSTLHFAAEAHRLHPEAMQLKSRFGVGADWPLTYADLEPYYSRAERVIGVAGPQKPPPGRMRSEPFPLPAHPMSYASQKLAAGCRKLGISWTQNPVAILSRAYRGRPPCNYCGSCSRGCPRLDKGSVDVTFIADAIKTGNCTIKSLSPVVQIKTGKNDSVTQVIYREAEGKLSSVNTRVLVIACGAIDTPKLLLSNTGPDSPAGLGNESGLAGKNFLETAFMTTSALHPEPLGSRRGIPTDSICWDYTAPDAIPGLIGGCSFQPAVASSDLLGPVSYAERIVPGWGKQHKQAMRDTYGRVLSISGIGESLPNPGSYIDLDPEMKDHDGLPVARIHSHLDKTAMQRLEFISKTSRDILQASGAEDIVEQYSSYDMFLSTHVFGTCRMGTNPDQSVVNPQLRSHRWKNLFIVDASVFPSSGGGESPSLTIEALALRTGDHIASLMRKKAL